MEKLYLIIFMLLHFVALYLFEDNRIAYYCIIGSLSIVLITIIGLYIMDAITEIKLYIISREKR